MPAVSKKQQQAMGIAHAIQKGEVKAKAGTPSAEIAKSMKPADVKEFAGTPHKGLPEKKKSNPGHAKAKPANPGPPSPAVAQPPRPQGVPRAELVPKPVGQLRKIPMRK
ncbi:MAG: DUF3008 family protein [Thermodesulfobacteriota bacterium]